MWEDGPQEKLQKVSLWATQRALLVPLWKVRLLFIATEACTENVGLSEDSGSLSGCICESCSHVLGYRTGRCIYVYNPNVCGEVRQVVHMPARHSIGFRRLRALVSKYFVLFCPPKRGRFSEIIAGLHGPQGILVGLLGGSGGLGK